MSKAPLLIIGGGIGGLAAGLALARAGHPVTLCEQAAAFSDVGAGIQLGPNATRALLALGVLERILDTATRPVAIEMRDGRTGGSLVREPVADAFTARYGTPYLQAHRADLHAVLADAARSAGVIVEHQAGLTTLEQTGDHVVARFEDGRERVAGGLIGADGLGSAVRATLFSPGPPRFTGQIAWRALVPANALPENLVPVVAGAWLADASHFVHYFVRGGSLVNIVGITESEVPGAEGWDEIGVIDEFRRAFADWASPVRALVAAAPVVHRWPLYDRPPLPRWSTGNVTLLGDACHPMLPFLAQGAAMALEDAVVLARCLSGSEQTLAAAFQRYEGLRRARTARVQAASRRNARLFHLPGSPLRQALGLALSVGAMVAPGRLSVRQDWLYGYDCTAALT